MSYLDGTITAFDRAHLPFPNGWILSMIPYEHSSEDDRGEWWEVMPLDSLKEFGKRRITHPWIVDTRRGLGEDILAFWSWAEGEPGGQWDEGTEASLKDSMESDQWGHERSYEDW